MQFLNYFLASIVSFAGLITGIILLRIAPEEQKMLKKHLGKMQVLAMLLIFGFSFFYFFNKISYLTILIVFCMLFFFISYKSKNAAKKSMAAYSTFGILFFLGSENLNLFAIISSLVFLYGIFSAAFMEKSKYKSFLIHNSAFILLANGLFCLITISHPLF